MLQLPPRSALPSALRPAAPPSRSHARARAWPALALAAGLLVGCGSGGGTGSSSSGGFVPCGFVPGQITTSAGSAGVGNQGISVAFGGSPTRFIRFNNTNLTFRGDVYNTSITGYAVTITPRVLDLGEVCLESVAPVPGAGTSLPITIFIGHAYLVEFTSVFQNYSNYPPRPPEVTYVGLTADAYDGNGVLTITYVTDL